MIRVLLQGRLGNNLYQIATGLALAQARKTRLVVDPCLLPKIPNGIVFRRLPVLQLPFPRKLASVAFDRFNQATRGRHTYELLSCPAYHEVSHDFDPGVAELGADAVLNGYFQDERHFTGIADRLPGWFDLTPWKALAEPGIQETLRGDDTVGVHVRRSDYLQIPFMQVCGIAYYQRAIERMRQTTPHARFVFFSDDIEWCREQFAPMNPLIVDHRHHPYGMLIDLGLLSACRHQIIANSSFSWWAAWLNPHPARRVLMPDRWTLDGTTAITTKALRGGELVATA